ncbi:MAG: nucleotidyltransferase domain-containing protein [Gemmatimonas sp.]|nr:nucleotidyltransferase domain-containing protein [Gemmatimonas sp.]
MRIWSFDREAALGRLHDWAARIGQRDDVLAVVLFGSMARGDATAASDADVLVLLRGSDLDFMERAVRMKPIGLVPAGVELFPYTLAEAECALREQSGVVPVALTEGHVLFEQPGALAALGARAQRS